MLWLNNHWSLINSLNLNYLRFFWLMLWLLSVSLNLDSTRFYTTALVCWLVLICFSGARLTWWLYLWSLFTSLNIDSRWCFSWLLSLFLWCLGWCCLIDHLRSSFIPRLFFSSRPTLRPTILLGWLPLLLLAFLIAFPTLLLLLFDAGVIIVAVALITATIFTIAVMSWVGWGLKFRWRLGGAFGGTGWEGIWLSGGKLVTRFH